MDKKIERLMQFMESDERKGWELWTECKNEQEYISFMHVVATQYADKCEKVGRVNLSGGIIRAIVYRKK